MTTFTAGIARVPNFLSTQLTSGRIAQTNLSLFRAAEQLSTGLAVGRYSDAAVQAATISYLDGRIEIGQQRAQNLGYADSSLTTLDSVMGDTAELLEQALTIASAQVSTGTTAEERRQQANVIESLIDSLYDRSNTRSIVGFVFGGPSPGNQPVTRHGTGYRFEGGEGGLMTDIGLGARVPVTMGASNAIGALAQGVMGQADLGVRLTGDTRLVDMQGARGLGVRTGSIELRYDANPAFSIDVSGADTIEDVVTLIEAGIRDQEAASGSTILGPGGVSIVNNSIAIDVPSGDLMVNDRLGGVTARDLGLATDPPASFNAGRSEGVALAPRLTVRTPVSALGNVSGPLGSIRINNAGRSAVVDLSAATTFGEVKALIEAQDLGVRVQVNADGTGFNVINEVASVRGQGLSIEEVGAAGQTASVLGIRSLDMNTRIDGFNDGRGVRVVSGSTDPISGLADPSRDVDFVVTLGDGFEVSIDLSPGDLVTVDTLLGAMQTQIGDQLAAAGRPFTDLEVGLSPTANGIAFTQDGVLGGTVSVRSRNNSQAAEDLGLLDASWDAGANRLVGEDRSKVRVNNVFTHMLDLREALLGNDTSGISLASESLQELTDQLTQNRALVGGFSRRVSDELLKQESREVADSAIRSELRDLDFTEAASRYSLLEVQLEAGLRTAGRSLQLTLLDFL